MANYTKYSVDRGRKGRQHPPAEPRPGLRPGRRDGARRRADGPRRKSLWLLLVQWLLLVLVASVAASGGIAYGWLTATLGRTAGSTEVEKVMVAKGKSALGQEVSGEPVYILLMGVDRSKYDAGRSDAIILVRLDPGPDKSIAMLSFPRDLYVELPGGGMGKLNAAYSYSGPENAQANVIQTIEKLTGIRANHFFDVNFDSFAAIVTRLGGVYVNVDHHYYYAHNGLPGDHMEIDLMPGYQRLGGGQALRFVRYRYDSNGDFGRMARQQIFLSELKRQALRWDNVKKLTGLVTDVAHYSLSDLGGNVGEWLSLAKLALGLNSSHIYQSRYDPSTTTATIGGVSYVTPSAEDTARVIYNFTNPLKPPMTNAAKIPRDAFTVRVLNGSGQNGAAELAATGLKAQGFRAAVAGNADRSDYSMTQIYCSSGLADNAVKLQELFGANSAQVTEMDRMPGRGAGIEVVLGQTFDGTLVPPPTPTPQVVEHILADSPYQIEDWRALQKLTPLKLQMPSAWAEGATYAPDAKTGAAPFYAYKVPVQGEKKLAAVVVGSAPGAPHDQYFTIQALRWKNPPTLASPNATLSGQELAHKLGIKYDAGSIKRDYRLYYQGDRLNMIAWQKNTTVYWITNTISLKLSDKLMGTMALSCKPLKAVK